MIIKQLYNINKSDADENRPGGTGATGLPQGSREERRMNLNEEILKLADEYESYIIDCRRKVHTFAELAMHEDKTHQMTLDEAGTVVCLTKEGAS